MIYFKNNKKIRIRCHHSMTETGRSMIEMLGVLAIIGVLSVGGISGYSKAMNQIKINKTINQIAQAYANVRTLCKDHPCMEDEGSMPTIVYPDDLTGCVERNYDGSWKIYSNCTHALGGIFRIDSLEPTEPYGSFEISVNGLNNDDCTKLATYNWKFEDLKGVSLEANSYGWPFYGVCIEDTILGDDHSPDDGDAIIRCSESVPLSPNDVSVVCSQCNTTGGCALNIAFYH